MKFTWIPFYKEFSQKLLKFRNDSDRGSCPLSPPTYDLNNVGNITKGEAGKPLYRYRVSYANNTLVVNNR